MELDFKDITLDTKPIIESYTRDWKLECSDFSFTNLFIWGAEGKMQYAQLNDVLYIKLDFPGFPVFLWAPLPKFGKEIAYKKTVETAFDYLKEVNTPPSLRSVGEFFMDKIRRDFPQFTITETPQSEDYVYLSESLINLKGKKLHGKRNHINKFIHTHPDFKYINLDSSMYEECMALYDEWSETKDEDAISKHNERISVSLALKNMDALGLSGGCIVLDGKIEAFTVGERLFSDMHLIHIEKANANINGLYPLINQQYAFRSCSDVTYINREEDMGIEGMRKAKQSYQPIKMIKKYMITP